MIKLMNLRNTKPTQPYDFRIDRTSIFGNPYPLRSEKYRDKVCDKYDKWFTTRMLHMTQIQKALQIMLMQYHAFNQLRLFCWCTPKRCHGETIKKWLEENAENKNFSKNR